MPTCLVDCTKVKSLKHWSKAYFSTAITDVPWCVPDMRSPCSELCCARCYMLWDFPSLTISYGTTECMVPIVFSVPWTKHIHLTQLSGDLGRWYWGSREVITHQVNPSWKSVTWYASSNDRLSALNYILDRRAMLWVYCIGVRTPTVNKLSSHNLFQ